MSSVELTIEDRVVQAISNNPYLSGRKLRFETADGRLVLKGVVTTYFQKQMAQEALRRVVDEAEIDNCLEVTWS